jgi:2-(1,2-epoxy-1,2-dihydrophenyl)acetyl-CoA isomerase
VAASRRLRKLGTVTYETILFERPGRYARLTLNRPHRLNSFTQQMHEEIRDALDHVGDDARSLVITGAGRAFCSGQDLNERQAIPGEQPDLGESVEKNYGPLVRRLRGLPVPVIAAVNGVAAGAGANLALACDIVVAAKSAEFVQPFCRIGLIPDTGGTYFLPRLAGTARALGLALLSERVTAEKAAEWGLIWKCVDARELHDSVEEITGNLAATPRLALASAKQAIHASAVNSLEEQLDLERDLLRELGQTSDYRKAIAAFLDERRGS